jgi:hypothetical protein
VAQMIGMFKLSRFAPPYQRRDDNQHSKATLIWIEIKRLNIFSHKQLAQPI